MSYRGPFAFLATLMFGLPVVPLHAASGIGSPVPHTQESRQGVISGRVTEAGTQQPLSGVNIVLVGTQRRAATGSDGRYTITEVPSGTYEIQASRIGLRAEAREVVVSENATVTADFALSTEAVQLQEVTVDVGYGQRRAIDITGSVVAVPQERMEQLPNRSVDEAIQGVAPGVTVQNTAAGAEGSTNIEIRGRNSIKANTEPLIVLDGIPYGGSLTDIPPNDVEAISILKDASSAAIYGSRGANGVILITTKKGQVGQLRFGYDGYAGIQKYTNVPELMTAMEFAEFKCTRRSDGVPCNGSPQLMESSLTPSEWDVLQSGAFPNWTELATRTGFQQNHNLSLSGGTNDTRYYVSGSLLDVDGIARGDDLLRSTLRLNLDHRVRDWLDIGTSTQFSWTDRSGVPADFGDFYQLNPLTRALEADGSQVIYPWADDIFFGNPLQGFLSDNEDVTRRVLSNSYAQLQLPIAGMSFRLNAGLELNDRLRTEFWGRNTARGIDAKGEARTTDNDEHGWVLENILRYERSIGPHNLDVTALYSAEGSQFREREVVAEDLPVDVLTVYQANVAGELSPSSFFLKTGLISQMGRLNYAYDDRYLLTLTARRDGASVFGEDHKYGVFPSVALAWNPSAEAFWPGGDAFNSLRVRFSYGKNGTQAIAPFATLSRLSEFSYVDGATTLAGFSPSALGNPDLKWETTSTGNLGLDFGLFGNRISGSVDLYRSRTHDLLLDRLIPSIHGITRVTQNIGEVENRGMELQLSSVNVEGERFRWTSDVNFSINHNEILDLFGTGADDLANAWFIGHPIEVNFGFVHDGVWQVGEEAEAATFNARPGDLRVKDSNGDGRITPDDREIISSGFPKWTGALMNRLEIGAFSVSALLYTVQGIQRSNPMLNVEWQVLDPQVRRNTLRLDVWTPENPSDFIPANRPNTNPLNVAFYQDASFVRLRDVSITYDVPTSPTSVSSRVGVDGARFYLSGRNLWTHTNWDNLDPELTSQDIPLEWTIMAGVRFGF